MKQIVLILMSILSFSCSSQTQRQATDTTEPVSKKILVVYFSCTGTTGRVAESIAGAVDGRLYRITPAEVYTSVEMADEDSRPELGGEPLDMKDYDIVFLGYPIWWDLCPRPVNTFLEKYDFSGKTVIPFATSGGSSIAHSVRQLRKLYPNVTWNDGKLLNGGVAVATEWAKQVVENTKKGSR